MILFIPPLQSKIALASPWTFTLKADYENLSFIETMVQQGIIDESALLALKNSISPSRYTSPMRKYNYHVFLTDLVTVTLPAGSYLKVEAMSMKPQKTAFRSISLRLLKTPTMDWKNARFKINIEYLNTMDIKPPTIGPAPIPATTTIHANLC